MCARPCAACFEARLKSPGRDLRAILVQSGHRGVLSLDLKAQLCEESKEDTPKNNRTSSYRALNFFKLHLILYDFD